MKIILSGRNIDLTEAIKDHVIEKMSRLDENFDFIQEVQVFLSVEKNPSIRDNQIAEATIYVHGAVIRVSTRSENLYKSIDELLDKAVRSMRKYKSKLKRSKHDKSGDSIRKPEEAEPAELTEEQEDESPDEGGDEEEVYLTYNQ